MTQFTRMALTLLVLWLLAIMFGFWMVNYYGTHL